MKNTVTLLVLCSSFLVGPLLGQDFGIRDGHMYTIMDSGIVEYDANLNLVSTLVIPDAELSAGIAFNNSGNLITTVGIVDPDFKIPIPFQHVVEINSQGQIVNNIPLGIAGFNRGSHIDVDSQGNIYAATVDGLVEVRSDFSSFSFVDHAFERVSGVAIGPDGKLYTTDQATDELVVFSEDRQFEQSFELGDVPSVPVGLDFNAAGDLYAALFLDQEIRLIDVEGQSSTILIDGLDDVSDISFGPDGSLYVSYDRGREFIAYDSDLQVFAKAQALSGAFGDSIVVFHANQIPEPAAAMMFGLGCVAITFRRSR